MQSIRLLLLFVLACVPPLAEAKSAPTPPYKVVIDPGHGGTDLGAVQIIDGYRVAEKDITLAIARKLVHLLRQRGIDGVLTRKEDEDIPLPERTAFANRIGADLFISLHMNSTPHPHQPKSGLPEAQGVETYILNTATDATSKRLAQLENMGLSIEKTVVDSDVSLILKDLTLDGNLAESMRLACALQNEVVSATSPPPLRKLRNRGVRQALFYVLLGANMPSALLEIGFLSHAFDRKLAGQKQGQDLLAESISKAITRFRGVSGATTRLASCKIH
ncbi:MAG: N-acetylmuramoyl-L-alanine amidase [Bdellovibrionota bacterium]